MLMSAVANGSAEVARGTTVGTVDGAAGTSSTPIQSYPSLKRILAIFPLPPYSPGELPVWEIRGIYLPIVPETAGRDGWTWLPSGTSTLGPSSRSSRSSRSSLLAGTPLADDDKDWLVDIMKQQKKLNNKL